MVAVAVALGGCIAFKGAITAVQLDVIGKMRVSFTICATDHSGGPEHPGCDERHNDQGNADAGNRQVLLGFRVPAGTVPPDSFKSTSGVSLTFTRSTSYERQLQEWVPAPAGQQWVGYISNVYAYDPGPDGTPAQEASFAVDFGLPPGQNGRPFPGPFPIRPVVGGRTVDTSDPASAGRPVSCGDDVYNAGSAPFSGSTVCIDAPPKGEVPGSFSFPTRDLGLLGSQASVSPGRRTNVAFTAQYAGAADPGARFTLTAAATAPGATATPANATLVPGANSNTPVGVSVAVPRTTPAGNYLVALAARLANGQQRLGFAALRVRDVTGPAIRRLNVEPDLVTPFPDTSSIAAARGARVSYRLSERATTTFKVQRCVRRRHRRCKYRTVKGRFRHKGKAGRNAFRFTGYVRHRRLRGGRYRLVGVAVDRAKNRGKSAKTGFRVRRRR